MKIIENCLHCRFCKNKKIPNFLSSWRRNVSFFTVLNLVLILGCAASSSQNNHDYLSLFFEKSETANEIILIDIQRIIDEFALIINDQNLKFDQGEKMQIIRNNTPIGLVNVVRIEGQKVIVKATLDDKNETMLLTDKIQYLIEN